MRRATTGSSTPPRELSGERPRQRSPGKTAVVTGASSGIGKAIAQRLVDGGARVALVGRSEERLREAASDWPDGSWLALPCDVRDSAAVQAMAARAEEELGRVDILVNSAGVFKVAPLTELDDETWRDLWETNVNGTLFPTRALLPGMVERGLGYVVIISSVAAHRGYAGMTGYGATKHAVTGFARALTTEVRRQGVRVVNAFVGPCGHADMGGREHLRCPPEEMLTADEVADAIIGAMTVSDKQVDRGPAAPPAGRPLLLMSCRW